MIDIIAKFAYEALRSAGSVVH